MIEKNNTKNNFYKLYLYIIWNNYALIILTPL